MGFNATFNTISAILAARFIGKGTDMQRGTNKFLSYNIVLTTPRHKRYWY